jgi:RNase P subunit RPR2
MDFLYKAAELLKSTPNSIALQRHLVVEARNISKRQVLRIDPSLKRN